MAFEIILNINGHEIVLTMKCYRYSKVLYEFAEMHYAGDKKIKISTDYPTFFFNGNEWSFKTIDLLEKFFQLLDMESSDLNIMSMIPFDGYELMTNRYAIFAYQMVKTEQIFTELYDIATLLNIEELIRLLVVKKSTKAFWKNSTHPLALKVRFLHKEMNTHPLII